MFSHILNYANDLVICCWTGAEQALATMQKMMSKLKLTVNDSKTRVCVLPEEKFDLLGYTFGQCHSPKLDEPTGWHILSQTTRSSVISSSLTAKELTAMCGF